MKYKQGATVATVKIVEGVEAYTDVQGLKAVSVHFTSEQILYFAFVGQ